MIRILIADDIAENRYLLEALLRGNGYDVTTAADGRQALDLARISPPDVIITDILMPVMDGFALCREWKADDQLKRIPFVFYTATYTDPKDEAFALGLGADRFIVKPKRPEEMIRMVREILEDARAGTLVAGAAPQRKEQDILQEYNAALQRKLEKKMSQLEETNEDLKREIVERKRIENELVYRNTLLATEQEASLDGIMVVDREGRIISCNRRFGELWGIPRDIILSQSDERALQFALDKVKDPERFLDKVKFLYEHRDQTSRDLIELKDCRIFDRYSSPIIGAGGRYYGRVWYFRDITEQKRLEEQLRHAQKMEAVGTLAGGVAHDFNNILSAIVGYGSILLMKLSADDPLRQHAEQILASSERAAGLTKSLLAFSRKQVMELKPVNINAMVFGFHKILGRLIGEDIEFKVSSAREDLMVNGDNGQLEQVLMNLVTNARDAMPKGGTLEIKTEKVSLDADQGEIRQGSYAVLSVSDTGFGIDKTNQEHIFEPFYTTKEAGKGTGLGLAIVYGIINKHNGSIHLYSEPGIGTTFKIYLPLIESADTKSPAPDAAVIPSGTEAILLVEDDNSVRAVNKAMLEEFGYTVIEASEGEEALRLFQENSGRIKLVLCDLIMPKMNGREVFEQIEKMQPGIKGIFISGYTSDIIAQKGIIEDSVNFISKPLILSTLLKKVREVLDSSASTA